MLGGDVTMPSTGSQSQVDAILCDVGDVLIVWDKEVPAAIERSYGLPEGSLLFETLKSRAGRLATIGRITHEEWLRQVTRRLPSKAVFEWLSYHGDLNTDLITLLSAARRVEMPVYFLTNATSRLWEDLAYHGIQDFADEVYCSASIGLAKPDPKLYQDVVSAISIRPERVLYIEDTPSWAEAGRRIGLVSHTFSGIPALKSELERLGMPVC
jgi:putative hydrolase of the HAD superfamily